MEFRVLMIDSDRLHCEQMEAELAREGCALSWCTRGVDGLELALKQPHDVVIVDMSLLDAGGGLAVCRRLRQTLPELPVILVASNADLRAAVSAGRAGAHDFFLKPLALEQLRRCIERLVRGRYQREVAQRLDEMQSSVGPASRKSMPGSESATASPLDPGHGLSEAFLPIHLHWPRNTGSNKAQPARRLSMDARTLYRKLQRVGPWRWAGMVAHSQPLGPANFPALRRRRQRAMAAFRRLSSHGSG